MAQWTVTVALAPVVLARQAPGVRIARWGGDDCELLSFWTVYAVELMYISLWSTHNKIPLNGSNFIQPLVSSVEKSIFVHTIIVPQSFQVHKLVWFYGAVSLSWDFQVACPSTTKTDAYIYAEAWPTEPCNLCCWVHTWCSKPRYAFSQFSVGGLGHRFWCTITFDLCTCSSIISN